MGVHGLWELLSPVGERVPNSHVRRKRVAVDASIWLTQFIRALREADGAQLANAHLIGVFRRCCKLLFLDVRPVLVFDGATPPLKRKTREIRRAQHDRDVAKLRRLAERLLMNQLRQAAVGAVSDAVRKRTRKSPARGRPSKRSRVLTPPPEPEEVDDDEPEFLNGPEVSIELPDDVHQIDDEAIVNLPDNVQAAIFKQIRQAQRAQHREQVMSRQTDPESFSHAQIEGFMRNTALNRRIRTVRNTINDKSGAKSRIASDSTRAFLLEEGDHVDDEDSNFEFESSDDEKTTQGSKLRMTKEDQQMDVLTRIRLQREERNQKNAQLLKERMPNSQRTDAGLGWAVRVLKTDGAHRLDGDNEILPQASRKEGSDEDSDDDDEWEDAVESKTNPGNLGSVSHNVKDTNGSDSDEWENTVTSGARAAACAVPRLNESELRPDDLNPDVQKAILQSTENMTRKSLDVLSSAPRLKVCERNGNGSTSTTKDLNNQAQTQKEPLFGQESSKEKNDVRSTEKLFSSNPDETDKDEQETATQTTTQQQREEGTDVKTARDGESKSATLSEPTVSNEEHEVSIPDHVEKEPIQSETLSTDNNITSELFNDEPAMSTAAPDLTERKERNVESSTIVAAESVLNATERNDERDEIRPATNAEEIERIRNDLERERVELVREQNNQQRVIGSVTDEMISETCELLRLFGIPYVQAPFEAEAQCAYFDQTGLVDGVITEDSDAFLFGAKTVYRHLFANGKFAEAYVTRSIERELGIDRHKLIQLAYLLGSDYTPGVRGIGIVNAMEVVQAFPGSEGLSEFFKWTKTVTMLDEKPEDDVLCGNTQEAIRRSFYWKHRVVKRNWVFRNDFPNPRVESEYLNPPVHRSVEPFKWGRVDFEGLQQFCWQKLGWNEAKFNDIVGPLRAELEQRKTRGPEQRRIDEFFQPFRFAKIKSIRLQRAVKGLAGDDNSSHIMAEIAPLGLGTRKSSAQEKQKEEEDLDNLFLQIDVDEEIRRQRSQRKPKLSQREELMRIGREAVAYNRRRR